MCGPVRALPKRIYNFYRSPYILGQAGHQGPNVRDTVQAAPIKLAKDNSGDDLH